MELPTKNVIVEYIDEDALFEDFFKHAGHMGVAAGYKSNYMARGQRIDDKTNLVKHCFYDSETMNHMFDLYEMENAEARAYDGEQQLARVSERMLQFVVPLKALKNHSHVKNDLELLCSRVFRKNPDWITVEEAPIPVEKEKPGCMGVLYGLLKS